tara:strand:- start:257 stop:460 length:204 start_codon:yes stop_codon:yes gene_type:complete
LELYHKLREFLKNMEYSTEMLYHFNCEKCKMWWSVASTPNMVLYNKTWYCTWCGHKHKPTHKNINIK